jgi:Transposase IS66 family
MAQARRGLRRVEATDLKIRRERRGDDFIYLIPGVGQDRDTRTLFEAGARGQTAERRQFTRRITSLPLVEVMKSWLTTELTRLPPRSGLADAIRYALTRWTAI